MSIMYVSKCLEMSRNVYNVCLEMSQIVSKCLLFRAYTSALLKSVLFRCHYSSDMDYPTYDIMSKHLNKTNHKVSFLGVRQNVGCTTFTASEPRDDMQHSFGIPRFFFRFNLTSDISNQPYGYVNWSMFKIHRCHRSSFEGSMTRREWTTGPTTRHNINPFCYIEDVIPSRFALGFDVETLDCCFMAVDPERVGLHNIEVPQVCDFGDNELDYMTRSGHVANKCNTEPEDENDDVCDDDSVDVANDDDDTDDDDSRCSSSSDGSTASMVPELTLPDYYGILPTKFINFLKS